MKTTTFQIDRKSSDPELCFMHFQFLKVRLQLDREAGSSWIVLERVALLGAISFKATLLCTCSLVPSSENRRDLLLAEKDPDWARSTVRNLLYIA